MYKLEQSSSLNANLEALHAQKHQEAEGVRKQRAMIQKHLRERREKELERNTIVAETIKAHEGEVQRQKMVQRMQHEEMLQLEMENRLITEEEKRNEARAAIIELEQREEVAIDSLRRTQEAQRTAFAELESALLNPISGDALRSSGLSMGGGRVTRR